MLRKELLTPRMLRVTFGGGELADLPLDFPGEIITLSFPGGDLRNYTVARYDPDGPELDVEFVLLRGTARGLGAAPRSAVAAAGRRRDHASADQDRVGAPARRASARGGS